MKENTNYTSEQDEEGAGYENVISYGELKNGYIIKIGEEAENQNERVTVRVRVPEKRKGNNKCYSSPLFN